MTLLNAEHFKKYIAILNPISKELIMHFYCYITLIITGIDTSSSDRVQRLQN